jgi:hypothetical protein
MLGAGDGNKSKRKADLEIIFKSSGTFTFDEMIVAGSNS